MLIKKRVVRHKLKPIAVTLLTAIFVIVLFSSCQITRSFIRTSLWHKPLYFIVPVEGYISQEFNRKHPGIDIVNAAGTPIVAAASGRVIKSGWDHWGLGNAITIQHSNGFQSVYGHNSELLVKEGEEVQQGQIIAKMGSTGNSTGSHLHLEILTGNPPEQVNPMNYLQIPPNLSR